MKENINKEFTFVSSLENYIKHIESLYNSFPLTIEIIYKSYETASKSFVDFVNTNGIKKVKEDGSTSYEIKVEDVSRFKKLRKRFESTHIAKSIIPESFLVSLISHYDAFLGSLIKALFYYKPEVLNNSDKKLTFSDLVNFGNVDKAREFIIEKEIESILRGSHSEHIEWLENKFKIELKKDKILWSKFIEITERRNLFVHCNGVVSSQYLEVCKKNGVVFEKDLVVGEKLFVSGAYFKNSYQTLFEIGVKLVNVLWRKFIVEDIDNADKHLNQICYDLISIEHYELAITLLDFATVILKKHSDIDQKIFTINQAQAYKWLNNEEKVNEILEKEDWSACSNDFKIAIDVLKNDFKSAFNIMKIIGKSSNMRMAYKEWPLFKEFRKEKEFKTIYKDIFSEDFTITEFEDIYTVKKEIFEKDTNLLN